MYKREGEVTRFLSKIFCLTVPKNAVGEPFSLSLFSGIRKVQVRGWGVVSSFSIESLLSYSAENFRRATLYDINIFEYRKFFMLQRVMSRFSVEFFRLAVPRKIRRGTVLCCVSENFRQPKSLWIRGRDNQNSPSKISCLTLSNNFVGQPF